MQVLDGRGRWIDGLYLWSFGYYDGGRILIPGGMSWTPLMRTVKRLVGGTNWGES